MTLPFPPCPPLSGIDAVVFDMDGLLLDTEMMARHALRLAGEALGVDLPAAFCELMIGVPVDGCRRLLIERFGDAALADRLLAGAGEQHEAQIDAGLLRVKPGGRELLQRLEDAGVPRAIATSSARSKALHQLSAAGLVERFDAIVTRDDVARGKPHPDLFLEAGRRLSQPPARCLALEDSHNGIRAAHAAGMAVVMVPDLLPATAEMRERCHCIAGDLHAIAPLLGL